MGCIGIDIGKRKCDCCIMDDVGRVVGRGRYPDTGDGTRGFAGETAAKYGKNGCRAACETTANIRRTAHNAFEREGVHIGPANTYHMSTISKTAKKTDKVDAEKIAHVLRMDMIPKCRAPRLDVQAAGNTVRMRVKPVQNRTQTANRIHGTPDAGGLGKTDGSLHSDAGLKHPKSLKLATEQDTGILLLCCRNIRRFNGEIKTLDTKIEEEAAGNEYTQILAGTTGAGIFTAFLLAVEIDDIERFKDPKNMVSWAGFCPTVHQSGDTTYHDKMKKRGTVRLVNRTTCEAANSAARHDPRMKAVYETARKRHADKHALAVVVVANKTMTIMWHMPETMEAMVNPPNPALPPRLTITSNVPV